ncbi:hypothetical protein D3C71_1724150 [compost metagenome]
MATSWWSTAAMAASRSSPRSTIRLPRSPCTKAPSTWCSPRPTRWKRWTGKAARPMSPAPTWTTTPTASISPSSRYWTASTAAWPAVVIRTMAKCMWCAAWPATRRSVTTPTRTSATARSTCPTRNCTPPRCGGSCRRRCCCAPSPASRTHWMVSSAPPMRCTSSPRWR